MRRPQRTLERAACARLLVVTALLGAAPAAATTLTRGPYLQLLTTQSATVVWNTDTPAACALAIHPLGGATTVIPGPTDTVCAIAPTGLSPGTQYAYAPLADGVALGPESVLRTDAPTPSFSFLVVGDSGCGCPAQLAVRDRMLGVAADFVLHTGDMIYDNGAAADFDPKFFAPYRDLVRTRVFWPCLGNHDIVADGGASWRAAFYTPANNPSGSEHYYSFDFGSAHVVVLDSNASTAPGSPQYVFLDQDLGASAAPWKFVALHHTIYSSSQHGSALAIRANLVPVFDRRGVDVVFMGHDHDYERTKPLRGDQIVAPGAGTVYITTGGGGKSLYSAGQSSFTAYAESAYHFTRVAVDGAAVGIEMIRDDGAVRDTLNLAKPTPTPRPAPTPQPISGDTLLIRDHADATKRKIVFVSKDWSIDTTAGTGIDPVADGAALQIYNAAGTGESVCLSLPNVAGAWRVAGDAPGLRYSYKDATFANGPCTTAAVKGGKRLKVTCRAAVRPIDYSLDEPAQERIGLRFTSGASTYCTEFGGTITRDSGTDPPIAGGGGRFSAKDAPAPVACSVAPPPCP